MFWKPPEVFTNESLYASNRAHRKKLKTVEQPLDPPKTCDEDGHVPVFLGEADGIDFYRCARCRFHWEE